MNPLWYLCIPGVVIFIAVLIIMIKAIPGKTKYPTNKQHVHSDTWDNIYKGRNW